MGCYSARGRREASFGFLLNDFEEGLRKAGISPGLVIFRGRIKRIGNKLGLGAS